MYPIREYLYRAVGLDLIRNLFQIFLLSIKTENKLITNIMLKNVKFQNKIVVTHCVMDIGSVTFY